MEKISNNIREYLRWVKKSFRITHFYDKEKAIRYKKEMLKDYPELKIKIFGWKMKGYFVVEKVK